MTKLLTCALLMPALAFAAEIPTPEIPKPRTLSNGLQVLVVEDHALPLVTIEIALKNGAMTEPPELNGLSHLYEHMFFKANAVLPTQEAYMARLRELGIQFNGTTGVERVNYYFTTTSDHFSDAMVFMRDAILTLRFDEKELERERVVVTGEMDRAEASPYYPFSREMAQRIWWKYPTRKQPLGERKTVLAATVDQMRLIQQRYYVPNNAILVVSGDVNPEEVYQQAERLYAGWKRGPEPFEKHPVPKHPPIPRSQVLAMEHPQVKTVNLSFVWHGPSSTDQDLTPTYAADLLTFAISEPSSKFQKALVDSGKCIRAGLSWSTAATTGPIYYSAEATPEKATECVEAMKAEIPKMKQPEYLTPEEMRNAVFREYVSQVHEREQPSNYAHTLTFWWTSAGLDYYANYIENLGKVKPADIASFIERYVEDEPFVFGALMSPEAVTRDGLTQQHFEKVLGIAGGKR